MSVISCYRYLQLNTCEVEKEMRTESDTRAATAETSGATGCSTSSGGKWPLERVLFAMAGTMTILSALLSVAVSPWFLLLTVFVGLNQWMFVAVGACPASLILSRAFGLRSVTVRQGR